MKAISKEKHGYGILKSSIVYIIKLNVLILKHLTYRLVLLFQIHL